ncbi:MAG: threonine dehydratase [Desulfatitalea sp. BRH_c12]|nr:MAG: threonine dehydratase [Desulfatitalea sp. BRH_c12]
MIALETIVQAARVIEGHILQTPLIYSPALSARFDAHIYLKLENLQRTGSFKIRGAAYKIIHGRGHGTISAKGVVAASAGNHAQGVALAASKAGLAATIVMPQWASIGKQEATRKYGGRVLIHGATVEESVAHARQIAAQGLTFIHPFDDADIIAGQATIGLEILSALPEVDTVLVPVGGGGLIAGIASALKTRHPRTRVVGVEAAACPSGQASLLAGRCVSVATGPSIADGINVKQLGRVPFEIIRRWVDDVVTVQEAYIAAAIQILLERKRVLAEGAGAAPLAALLNGTVRTHSGEKIVLLISGGNVDTPLLGRILHQGLLKNGRIMRVRLTLNDKPGTLACLLATIADLQANILHIRHDRSVERQAIDKTSVELELETRNADHIQEIIRALGAADYVMEPIGCPDPVSSELEKK